MCFLCVPDVIPFAAVQGSRVKLSNGRAIHMHLVLVSADIKAVRLLPTYFLIETYPAPAFLFCVLTPPLLPPLFIRRYTAGHAFVSQILGCKNRSTISLTSGCQLFLRHVSRLVAESVGEEGFDESCKQQLLDR